LKGFEDFYPKAKARIWPSLSCVRHIRSTAEGGHPNSGINLIPAFRSTLPYCIPKHPTECRGCLDAGISSGQVLSLNTREFPACNENYHTTRLKIRVRKIMCSKFGIFGNSRVFDLDTWRDGIRSSTHTRQDVPVHTVAISSKVNLHHATHFRALCGENLDTYLKTSPTETRVAHRVKVGCRWET